ncbi:hypothetical protein GCM10027168_59900 [Streptomyces capparidis]
MSWIDVDYDEDKWLWMPTSWGRDEPFDSPKDWARVYADALWELQEEEPADEVVVEDLERALAMLAERITEALPRKTPYLNSVYCYVPDPRRLPLPLYVQVWPIEGTREQRLREIVRADDDEAVEKPIVEPFPTEHLGDGLRAVRYFTDPAEGELACSLNYAWRLEEHGFDLHLWSVTGHLGWLAVAMDDFDDLARTVRVRDDGERDAAAAAVPAYDDEAEDEAGGEERGDGGRAR